jgi:hypothetical protein
MVTHLHNIRTLTEPISFNVAGIPASERRALIGLQTRIKVTGRICGAVRDRSDDHR